MRINHLYPLYYLRTQNLHPLYHLVNRLINKVLSIPSDVACGLHSNNWFEESILLPQYQRRIEQYKEELPKLGVGDLAIVKQIEQEGVCITSLDALGIPNSQQLWESAQHITNELAQQSHSSSNAYKHTLMATADQLMAHSNVFLWGMSERILKIVECYLGLPVAYDGVSFYYSVADGRDVGPRIWHRDKEDWRMIKVAIYLNDVDEFGGPYQCVKPHINTWLLETLPKYKGLTHAELQLLLHTDSSDWLNSCTGKAETVIFTDTARCYHRGKPPIKMDRSAIFFHYFSDRPKNPFYCDRSLLSRDQKAELAKRLPAHLHQHITWRDQYPGLGKYIPKNYMRVDNW